MNYINEIAEALSASHAAVMVGAGFSKNADNISSTDKCFKNWNELSDEFYNTLYGENGPGKEYNSSLRLAQEVEVIAGRPKLEKILKDAIPDDDYGPSVLYRKLMELPWRDVFTTNYDTLLEKTADTISKRRYNIVVNQEDLINSNDAARIIKLHGSFPSHRPFIITEEDYRTYPIKFAAMVNTVQQSLLENVFCMIGFSCEDPNFLSWIGWIHDNLGKSSSQKIYMIAVSNIPEVKQKMLLDKNIIVVNLEKIYPEKNIQQRLESFFDSLNKLIEERSIKDQWFDISKDRIEENDDYEAKTKKLKKLNDTYPGWIFLPWGMKFKVHRILDSLERDCYFNKKEKLEDLSKDLQISYFYEYVRFLNIVGRPIVLEDANEIWELLNKIENQDNKKIQYIYLQLLRSFRELAEWEKYDICRNKIIATLLDYENKQFLYACDWWMNLYRFTDVDLLDLLDSWNLTTGDIYWPLIKAEMYSLVGERTKARQLLISILPLIRKQLMKDNRNTYLCSIEESIVTLLNFIGGSNFGTIKERETSIHSQKISWWDTNSNYCLQLNKENNSNVTEKINYDLTTTYTIIQGNYDSKVYYALEYLRFLEQTGHPFRIGYSVIKQGFSSFVNTLYVYYPHLCFVQILISQDDKELDLLYGRNKLSQMTQLKVDENLQQYLDILNIIKKNIQHNYLKKTSSIYNCSAKILPEIISRFCYKCSTMMLDKVLEQMLILCNSNINEWFCSIDKVLRCICNAYTIEEQRERINNILKFPIKKNRRHNYVDPVLYLKKPKEKYKLDDETYKNTLNQIRQFIDVGDVDEKSDALNRLIVLNHCICLKESEKKYLFNKLEERGKITDFKFLFHFDHEHYKKNIQFILSDTLKIIESDSNKHIFSSRNSDYEELLEVLPYFSSSIDCLSSIFSNMIKLIESCMKWNEEDTAYEAEQRVRQSYVLCLGLIMLKIKNTEEFTKKEKEIIVDYFNKLGAYYSKSSLLKYIVQLLLNHFRDDSKNSTLAEWYKTMEEELWACSKEDLIILCGFYWMSNRMNFNLTISKWFMHFSIEVYQMVIYKIINIDVIDEKLSLSLLYVLLENKIKDDEINVKLFINLSKIEEKTRIQSGDSEYIALKKFSIRIEVCNIARKYYRLGYRHENILKWKELTNDTNEFIEIRNIRFED